MGEEGHHTAPPGSSEQVGKQVGQEGHHTAPPGSSEQVGRRVGWNGEGQAPPGSSELVGRQQAGQQAGSSSHLGTRNWKNPCFGGMLVRGILMG